MGYRVYFDEVIDDVQPNGFLSDEKSVQRDESYCIFPELHKVLDNSGSFCYPQKS